MEENGNALGKREERRRKPLGIPVERGWKPMGTPKARGGNRRGPRRPGAMIIGNLIELRVTIAGAPLRLEARREANCRARAAIAREPCGKQQATAEVLPKMARTRFAWMISGPV